MSGGGGVRSRGGGVSEWRGWANGVVEGIGDPDDRVAGGWLIRMCRGMPAKRLFSSPGCLCPRGVSAVLSLQVVSPHSLLDWRLQR